MKYDDASWHFGGDYPEDLPIENAFTHTGIFLAWYINHNLVSEEFIEDFADEAEQLKSREITGGRLFQIMDGKLCDDDLSPQGQRFANLYYQSDSGFEHNYYSDYGSVIEEDDKRIGAERALPYTILRILGNIMI